LSDPPRHAPPLPIVALFGPTAVGKTAVAIALAERLRARGEDPVAVSADALQLYAGLEILTGAATPQERGSLEHRLLGVLALTETASAGAFARLAHAEIDALLAQGRRPLVVGGTGLYLRAALADLSFRPPPDAATRARHQARLVQSGPAALHAELARRDPGAAAGIAPTDAQRLVRALELLDAGASPPPPPDDARSELWTGATRRPTLLVGLVCDREVLAARIDARIDRMLAAGVEAEVRQAAASGASATARKALGFQDLLDGDVGAMRIRTRRFAKRQLTWMRKLPDVHHVDLSDGDPDRAAAAILAMIEA
jgi:tRNA dimethylallyltransferase